MELYLKEPSNPRYLHIGPGNKVHVFMPIVGGTSIGTDNTCKAVYALREFFGLGDNLEHKTTLKNELLAYRKALEFDLSFLGVETPVGQQKQERLTQIDAYLEVFNYLQFHVELKSLKSGYPSYPRPLESMMQDISRSNIYSMVLRPSIEDGYLRLETANPVFSLAHKSVARNIEKSTSQLQQALIKAYTPLKFETKGLQLEVMQKTLEDLGTSSASEPVNFQSLISIFQKNLRVMMHDESIDLTYTYGGERIDQNLLDEALAYDPTNTTPQEYMNALLEFCVPKLFTTNSESPFNRLANEERFSIATQFLVGIINIDGVIQGHVRPEINWGQILDADPEVSESLAVTLAEAQKANNSIEFACLSWINEHAVALGLNQAFSSEDIERLKNTFARVYRQIEDSPHFDEFLIFRGDKPGDFVTHQASICTSFATFACQAQFKLPKKLTDLMTRAQAGLADLGTEIGDNPIRQEKITIGLTNMPLDEVQSLYEKINNYEDPKIIAQLKAQLKKECPGFKAKVDARQFLQHVAYGEQNEAETFLRKKDVDFAQALLTASSTSFTDFSGRTFTCTAYEYAYWAKDTHMCRMLEKYMDDATKQELLQRVLRIEQIEGIGLFQAPKGLTYTTKDGTTCNSAHFDISPLLQALQAYIQATKDSPRRTPADMRVLEPFCMKVGLLQRDVPAHIAHEYCHPKRSFYDVIQDSSLLDESNPDNLIRNLKYYNTITLRGGVPDFRKWFIPNSYSLITGLGDYFAIVRGDRQWDALTVSPCYNLNQEMFLNAMRDKHALQFIDKTRTEDLKQSRANLKAPSILQMNQFAMP